MFLTNRNLKFRGCIGRSFLASVTSALLLSAAQAATLTVTSASDSGVGTLRQAILNASPSGGDTINFAAGITTINLTSGELLINKKLRINGPGPNLLTVQRSSAAAFRIFNITSASIPATISGLRIAGGNAEIGAGVYCVGGTITNCVITNNQAVGDAPEGGGVYCDGGTVSHCVISGNSVTSTNTDHYSAFAEGGGIYAISQTQIDYSTVTNNTLTGYYADGAGIYANNGSVQNCTISGNTAYGHWYASGGGVFMTANVDGLVRNCLITVNNAHTDRGDFSANWASGGGVYFNGGGTLESSTIYGNTLDGDTSTGGGLTYGGQVRNTIIYGNIATARMTVTGPNYYLNPYGPATFEHCCSTPQPAGVGNIASPPGFASGGYRLGTGSPCINTGTNQTWMATATDLDGNRRIANGTVDMGAFEFGSVAVPVVDFNGDTFTDYLLLNPGTGRTAIWNLHGNAFLSGVYGPILPAGWVVACVADLNLDGKPDYILFNASTRRTAIWFLDNSVSIGSIYGPTLPAGWTLIAATDFNHDGHPDYVLFNASTRQTTIWYLNGTGYVSGAYGPTLPFGWTLTAALDLNGNDNPDFLLRNANTRQTALWYLNGAAYVSSAFGPTLPAGWTLEGAADFNSDGKPDYVLYQASTRRTALWYLNGATYVSSAFGPTLTAGYVLASP